MGSRTAARPSRKRTSSPQPDESSDNEIATVKRRRSDESSNKENGENHNQVVGSPSPAKARSARASIAETLASPMTDRNKNIAGKPPEAGVIKKIDVENFMCHRKFTVDLNRNVNFITGQNGSGKSAILAAIQICLGAGARRTHRARNLKELIRKDAGPNCPAKVRVTLLNKGADGYQNDVYGDTITVERTIARSGGYNGYKLYDSNMQELSRSKKDLDDMLDKLNIQVENPVAILDQEEAKKFLTGKAEDKYNFFMKATELERIDRTYASTLDKVADLDTQSNKMNQTIEADMNLVAETKKQWEQHQEIEKLQRKLRAYEEAYAWAIHQAATETIVGATGDNEKFREKAAKKKEELTQAELASQGPDDEELAKRTKLEELVQEAQEQSRMKHDLEADVKRATEPQKALERKTKVLNQEMKGAEVNLRNASKRLQDKREEILARAGSAQSEEARRTQRLKEAEDNLASARQKYDKNKQAVTDALREYEQLEPHVEQAKHNCNAAKNRLNAVENRIRGLGNSNSSSLAMFGQRCSSVKQNVDEFIRKGRFQGPVLGPIGAYVKIVAGKEQFASIAEQAIGIGALDRFIVTNDHDRKVLQSIRKKVGCQQDCGIFQIHQHPKYDVPQPPVEGIETVASVLNISNDLVFNCLVDNCKIDERALSQSREESERLLLVKGNNGRYSIRGKVKNVFILPQGDNWSVRDGNISMVANEKKLRQTIGVDKSAALADAKREAQSIKEELDVLRREESRLEHEHHEHQKDWNVKKRENQKIAKDIDKCVVVCDNIRNEQVAAASFDTDTSSEESDVAEAQAAADALKEEEQTLKEQIEENKPEIQDLKAKLEEVRTRNYKVLEDIKVAEDDLAQYVQSISQREEKLEKKREKVRQYETIIEQQEQKVKRLKASAKEDLKNARKIAYQRIMEERREALETGGKEVDDSQFTQDPTDEDLEEIEITETDKEPSYYEARMARATRKIEQEKERRNATRDDPAIAFQKYDRAKKKLQGKVEQIKQIDETSENLKKDMQQRKKRWRQFRTHIATTTDQRFDEILNLKGSSGEIEFDHVGNQLHLVVQKDAKDANSQQKDVKALSGGERSYTTIALLLALGESLETPFRVLDEFDVFLDPVTRKLTIDALIRMAKAMQHRQFIFITPQDVSQVEVDPMLYVLKMRPPSRNDVAGGPTQRTLDFSQTQS